MTRNKKIALASLFIVVSAIGCIWSFFEGDKFMLYFTNLSNYLCLIMMCVELIRMIRHRQLSHALAITLFCTMIAIVITGIIYNTLLTTPFEDGYWTNYHSIIMHLINPSLFVIYYFAAGLGKSLRLRDTAWCVLFPYLYLLMIVIRHFITCDSWFPYFFVDPAKAGGVSGIALWIAIQSVFFIALGLLLRYLGSIGKPARSGDC